MVTLQAVLRRTSFIIIALALITELIITITILDIFRIKYIVTDNYYSPLFLSQGNENFLNFDTEMLAEKIEQENPKIKDVSIDKQIPNTLLFNYSRRLPVAIVTDRQEDSYYYADSDGVIIEVAANKKLPLLVTKRITLKPGAQLSGKEETLALQLLYEITSTNIELISLAIEEEAIVADIGTTSVVFSTQTNAIDKIAALQLLLKRYTMEGKMPHKIDMRFSKPIVNNG